LIFRRIFSTDDITSKNATENFHNLCITKTVQLPYLPVFTRHVTVENLGFSRFIDTHMHLVFTGITDAGVDLSKVRSIIDTLGCIKNRTENTEPGQ